MTAGVVNALSGVRVLDLSRVLAGPLVGQMLGDLGAEVIKLEQPVFGDESRQYGPPFAGDPGDPATRGSAFFLSANRNKKSVAIDFSKKEGRAVVMALAAQSDVFIENFRVGTLKKYQLDCESLRAANPGLVYCSITGYGQTGPYHARPGYDAVFQAMGGLMSSIGLPDDHAAGGPLRTGVSITDVITGQYAMTGITAALYRRQANGGLGCHLDIALLDSAVAAMSHYAMHFLISGTVLPRRGNGGNGGVPSQGFECTDGMIMLTVGNDRQFHRFSAALGHPEWGIDERFATGPARIRNRDALMPMLEAIFRTQSKAHWLRLLVDAEIPSGPINDMAEVFADPQVLHRAMKVHVGPAEAGVDLIGNPIHFSGEATTPHAPPPTLGQHTDQVLGDLLGLGTEQLAALRAAGAI